MDTYNGWSLRRTIYVGILMVSILCNFYYPIKTRFISLKEQHFLESSKSRDCNIDRLLLEKCSELDFVTLRTYRRLSSNKNAIYVHGTRIINLGENYFISVDDILFGYDILFEKDYLYSMGSWLGVQFQSSPHDAIVFQQLIWKIKPDLIIDLGTNVGGSAVFFASIMSFYSDVGIVLTIDRKSFTKNWVPNKNLLCKDCVNPIDHKLWKKYVHFIQGTTIDPQVLNKVKNYVLNATTIFISQDAAHDGPSVYQDILNYAEFVSINSYMVIQDTKLDRINEYSVGPLAAVRKFMDYQNKNVENLTYRFEVDRSVEVFYYSQHAYGWLKRVK